MSKAPPNNAITPARRAILERIARHPHTLELQITASGGRNLSHVEALIRAGYVRRIDHPTVKRAGYPADALQITDEGREALCPHH